MTQQTTNIKLQSQGQSIAPSPEIQRLHLFVGTWNTEGETHASADAPILTLVGVGKACRRHSLSHGETSLYPSSNIGSYNMSRKAIATKVQSLQPPLTPSPELRRLDIFVGKWPTDGLSYGLGQSHENPYDSSVRWLGEETYEWLPGGFFLIRHFNGQIGDLPISGMETIGYDAASQTYPSQVFDNYGRIHLGQRRFHDGIWSYTGTEYRATYTFRNEGNNMATHWEWLCEDDWSVLMDSEAVKVE